MRKEQLVRALLRLADASKSKSSRNGSSKKAAAKTTSAKRRKSTASAGKSAASAKSPTSRAKSTARSSKKATSPTAARRIRKVNAKRTESKDLALAHSNGTSNGKANSGPVKDRAVLMVRDAYWLQASWEVTRQSVQRVRAAMAEHWHLAKPTLRMLEVDGGTTTSAAERVARDIEIHGGVNNWYIDIKTPPKSYRIAVGYLSQDGRFFQIVRSNVITTPMPGSSDAIDKNWTDVAENYEKIYAQSGGHEESNAGELQEMFEERLRRPMGAPMVTRYGIGAEATLNRKRDFEFEVDAEMIIYGTTRPDAHVTLGGEPVKLRADGTFTVRLSMPDKRQVLPVVASSGDGMEQRTIVLAVERNTKVMEPYVRDPNAPQ
ncbi:MAG: DUF4912 domain-containing protein [Pirellulaceae bacterium]